jgi:pyruvate kinase
MNSKAQIIATIGPASESPEILVSMMRHQMDVVRLNFSWGGFEEKKIHIAMIRAAARKTGRRIPIIVDLPGPRIQEKGFHTYDKSAVCSITERDKDFIKFGIEQRADYFALSFVGSEKDVLLCRKIIKSFGGRQPIIAKIERKIALESLDKIIAASDAVMVARGDLGNEVPLEQIPFIQDRIIKKAKVARKPVITATQMMLSMTESPTPTRAEVTDVANAILQGSDAVMLSEETASGKYPVESVAMMEKIVLEAEKHLKGKVHFDILK